MKRLLHALHRQRARDCQLTVQQEIRNTVNIIPSRFTLIQANVHSKFIRGQQGADFIFLHTLLKSNAEKHSMVCQLQAIREIGFVQSF